MGQLYDELKGTARVRLSHSAIVWGRSEADLRQTVRLLFCGHEGADRLWSEGTSAGRSVEMWRDLARPPRLERGTPGLEGPWSETLKNRPELVDVARPIGYHVFPQNVSRGTTIRLI